MSNEAETFIKTLAGREVAFRRPVLGQLLILERIYLRQLKAAQDNSDQKQRIAASTTAMMKVLDFIDSLVINGEDRQFIEDNMIDGKIDHMDLLDVLGAGLKDSQEDDAPPAVKKVAKKATSARTKR
jgi:hypothetical protein